MKLSVIIVSYKNKESLSRCLDSIFSKIGKNGKWEIIIVNNDQEDLPDSLKERQQIKIIKSSCNLGFGGGINVGAKEAKGEYLLFLNPDAEIISDQIYRIFKEFDLNPELGIIGSKIVDKRDIVEPWSVGRESSFINLILNNVGISSSRKIWESKGVVETDWVSGAALFIRRNLFLESGGFDENFFLYFEDMDLCKNIRKQGYRVYYFPEFSVRHEGGKSFKNKETQKRYYYESMEKYFLKHHGKIAWIIIKLARKFFQK